MDANKLKALIEMVQAAGQELAPPIQPNPARIQPTPGQTLQPFQGVSQAPMQSAPTELNVPMPAGRSLQDKPEMGVDEMELKKRALQQMLQQQGR